MNFFLKDLRIAAIVAILICTVPHSSYSQVKGHAELDVPFGAPRAILLPSANGPTRAIEREARITTTDASGYSMKVPMVVIAVPSRKLFWLGAKGTMTYFILGDKVVAAQAGMGDALDFYPSTDRMEFSEDEKTIKNTLSKRLANYATETLTYERFSISVRMSDFLGFFPFTGVARALGSPAANIENVSVDTHGFTINLSGGKENKVKASISFSNDFIVTRAVLKGKKTYPQ